MNPFITGSRAYGTVTPKSDIDLVLRVDPLLAEVLRTLSESDTAIRFGKLNLILCTTDTEYAMWKVGTEKLKRCNVRPTREEAVALLGDLRNQLGLPQKGDYCTGDPTDEQEQRDHHNGEQPTRTSCSTPPSNLDGDWYSN